MKRIFVALLIGLIGFWGYRQVQGRTYHRSIQPSDVERVEVLEKWPDYRTASPAETVAIIDWVNRGRFSGVNASLAGPGCSATAVFIYLYSGERVGLSANGDRLEVSRDKEPYFLRQDDLLRFIREQQKGCP